MAEARCPDCGAPLRVGAPLCEACAFGECLQPGAGAGAFRLEGHEVLHELARGGAGVVYRARQAEPAREVALKMLLPQHATTAVAIERFRLEAATVASLDHPAILPLFAAGEHDGLPWFTMKLASGGSLAERSTSYRGQWRQIAELLQTLAEAVQFAHSRGVLHRDLKPSNVLFDEAGRPYISDFGIAKLAGTEQALTLTESLLGTPAYLAPEVAESGGRAATTASDVYALGAILYELLAGRPPFQGESLAALLRQIAETAPPALPAEVPRDLDVIARCALEKTPAARIVSAAEFAAELQRWLDGQPIRSRRARRTERLARWARRNPALAGLSAALALATAAGGLALWQGNRELTRALEQARAAGQAERAALRDALIAQARGLRRSGRQGQSREALRLLRQAAESAEDVRWRAEAAAALALPDAEWLGRELPVSVRSASSTVAYASDFSRYACAAPRDRSQPGDSVLRSSEDGHILLELPNAHPSPCEHFRFSPSGRLLRVRHADGAIFVWDLETRTQRLAIPPIPGATGCCSFGLADEILWKQADGRLSGGGEAAESAIAQGACWIAPGSRGLILLGFPDRVEARAAGRMQWRLPMACSAEEPAWSPDGKWLAVSERLRAEINILQASDGALLARLSGHAQPAAFLAFHPKGELLASLSPDRTLRLWNARTGELLWTGSAALRALAWSRDGRTLAAFRTPLKLDALAFHEPSVFREWPSQPRPAADYFGMVSDARGERIVTAEPSLIRVWYPARAELVEIPCPSAPARSAYSVGNGEVIVTGSDQGEIQSLSAASPADPPKSVGKGRLLSAGPGDAPWFVFEQSSRRLCIWPAGEAAQASLLREGEPYFGVRASPDRRLAVLLGVTRPLTEIAELARPEVRRELDLGAHAQVDWSPDSAFLLTGTPIDYRVYRASDWQKMAEWPAALSGEPFARVAWSPDGKWIATQSGAAEVEIRSVPGWNLRLRLEAPGWVGALHDLAFAPDSRRLRLFAGLHQIYEWDLARLEEELRALGGTNPPRSPRPTR